MRRLQQTACVPQQCRCQASCSCTKNARCLVLQLCFVCTAGCINIYHGLVLPLAVDFLHATVRLNGNSLAQHQELSCVLLICSIRQNKIPGTNTATTFKAGGMSQLQVSSSISGILVDCRYDLPQYYCGAHERFLINVWFSIEKWIVQKTTCYQQQNLVFCQRWPEAFRL